MIAHFKTACGAEQYKHIEKADCGMQYRIPISFPVSYGDPMSGQATRYAYRVFTLVSIDRNYMAHYEEVLGLER